ncbi:ABC transporter permease [Granulicella sp. S156]|uniref:ABC transporter permease n=1 Tax=Granulicella sp. S156 TaxID=1747224 RepID=UPI00131EBD14|nr:ABC transporter permease [Granulicella sp. S156]
MKFLRRFFIRLSNFTAGRHADQRLQEEMAEHLALQTEENLRAGMSPAEARRQAALKLGAAQAIREHHNAEQGLPLAENFLFDLRYAFRMLRRSPGFSLIVIATIALGVGATTAIYSVIDATLLHPLPFPHPGEIVHIEANLPGVGAHDVGFSIPELRDLRNSGIFQNVSFFFFGSENVTGSAQPTHIAGATVSASYFAVLGVDAALGRTFDPHDASPGSNGEVVISDGLWKRAFGADPHILSKSLRLDNDLFHIVGVMPASFRDQGRTSEQVGTELWASDGFYGDDASPPMRGTRTGYETIARLQPGLSPEAAQARLDALVASLKKQYPADYPPQAEWTIHVTPLAETLVGNVRQSLILLFGAVGLVLLISCVNVANLLLARASARGREMAVRQALGAARMRLIRQLLTESLLLFVLGGITGFAVLFCARKFLLQFVPESLPRLNDISISWGVLAFAIVVSVAAGTIFGLAPAWLVSRLDLNTTLRQEGRGTNGSRKRSRLRHALVIGELALSLVLLVAAGLLLRSFWDLFKVQLGFNPSRITAIETTLPNPNDPKTDIYHTATQESVFLREALRRIRTLPGVEETAVSDRAALPLGHAQNDLRPEPLIREGQDVQSSQPPLIDRSIVSPEYFHVLGMTLLRGRLFVDQDLEATPLVAVINEAAARTYWRHQDPVGKRVRLSAGQPDWTTIVGVIANARTESLADAGTPQIYLSLYQHPAKFLAFYLRGQVDPAAILAQVRTQVQAVNPELPVFRAETLDDVLSSSLSVRRFSMEMVALFAATALLLAALGIYGTISFLVHEQSREIAIRLALGAQRSNILRMVLRQGLNLAAVGAGIGLVGAFIVSHLMAGLLYGVSPYDLSTFAGVTAVLTAVAIAASYVPALRAMRLDPITTLNSG